MLHEELEIAKRWGHNRLSTWFEIPRWERAMIVAHERQMRALEDFAEEMS